MELIKGGELFDRITKKTFYNENDARDLCRTILSAIKHCHDNDIVHRWVLFHPLFLYFFSTRRVSDLKPENLLMSKDDDDADVKLVDFGFADVCQGDTLRGVMGTPMYMAPEGNN